jgi:hypothetical protein
LLASTKLLTPFWPTGEPSRPPSAYLFLAALDADSTGVELIAVLDSIAATQSRDYYQSGR